MVGASASLYATSTFATSNVDSPAERSKELSGKKSSNIMRGVALYSYQEEFYNGMMTLEDCISELADIGAYGIEMPPEMTIRNFPHISNEWLDEWFNLMGNTIPHLFAIHKCRINQKTLMS